MIKADLHRRLRNIITILNMLLDDKPLNLVEVEDKAQYILDIIKSIRESEK
jgi:hypothetical protein